MKNQFTNIFKGKTVIIGMGNMLRGDDAFGPALIDNLNGRIKALCIDAGTAPENYLGKVVKENPDTILLVDAADIDKEPGAYCILKKDEIIKSGFTTHDISPSMLMEYLEKETAAEIYMLAVQPEKINFGEDMSESIKKSLKNISKIIMEANNA